jgi:hypothetical protein
MKTYRVSFDLILDDEANHPRKWLAEAIWECLRSESGEDIDNLEIAEVLNKDEE